MSSTSLLEVENRVLELEKVNKLLSKTTSMPNGSYKSALVSDLTNFIDSGDDQPAVLQLELANLQISELESELRNALEVIPTLKHKIARLESEEITPDPDHDTETLPPRNLKPIIFIAFVLGIVIGFQL